MQRSVVSAQKKWNKKKERDAWPRGDSTRFRNKGTLGYLLKKG